MCFIGSAAQSSDVDWRSVNVDEWRVGNWNTAVDQAFRCSVLQTLEHQCDQSVTCFNRAARSALSINRSVMSRAVQKP